jgi:O-antigen ligase
MIQDHPVLGTGAGSFSDEFRNYTTEWRFRISQGHAHNAYLQVAAETGITGLVAYLALLATIVWRLLAGARTMDGRWRCWAALAVSVSLMVHGLFDYLHVLSLGIVLSGIWAYGLAGASRGVAPVDHNSSL